MDNVKTKAGIQPVQTELPFIITTGEAEKFLQRKFSLLGGHLSNTQVSLFTTEVSKKFLPFMLLLPTSVMKGKGSRNSDGELSIFNPVNDDNRVNLQNEVFSTIAPYVFNKADEQAFFSPDWRREREVSASMSNKLKFTRTPHIQKYNNNKVQFVAMLIDPVRLFHDMLSDPDRKEQFQIQIGRSEKVKTGEYRYNVIKRINTFDRRPKNYDEILANEINRKMRG